MGWEAFYEVSDLGNVRSLHWSPPRPLRPGISGVGYPLVVLARDRMKTSRMVHHLVSEAFIGPRPARHDINHIDANRTNNVLANLEYCTRKQNVHHMFVLGRARPENGRRARTHCPQGHVYDEANTRLTKEGWRICRTCRNTRRAMKGAA